MLEILGVNSLDESFSFVIDLVIKYYSSKKDSEDVSCNVSQNDKNHAVYIRKTSLRKKIIQGVTI